MLLAEKLVVLSGGNIAAQCWAQVVREQVIRDAMCKDYGLNLGLCKQIAIKNSTHIYVDMSEQHIALCL